MKLNYKKVGEGKPLIILHGLFGSLDNWMGIAKTLGEHFEVFVVDARNHGQSLHSEEFDYEVMANDLADFISEYKLNSPIILGHSMGGKTAMQFAMNYPDKLSKLIVVDIAPKSYPIHHRQIIDGLLSLDFDVLKTRTEADIELGKYIEDISVRQFLLKNLYWVEKDKLRWRFNLDVINKQIEAIGKGLNNIHQFNLPTLFVRGERSNYILDSDIESMRSIFSEAEVKTVSDSGHWVHAENQLEFLKTIMNFLMN
ncbi:MAG: alpha/beta fold hydrolase [Flavobacteriales bacterium]|nr:alpha/beta fold hydrolase [Flavobacteriales bacterium]